MKMQIQLYNLNLPFSTLVLICELKTYFTALYVAKLKCITQID